MEELDESWKEPTSKDGRTDPNSMRIVAVIQARMGSSRFPGKVLLDLHGKPLLYRISEQVRASVHRPEIVLTASLDPRDEALQDFARAQGWACYRGAADDIVGRLHGAAAALERAAAIVRIWGDCPFVCPDVIDAMLEVFVADGLDYCTNAQPSNRTYPPGLDVEIYRYDWLARLAGAENDPFLREFPMEYVMANPNRVRSRVFRSQEDHSHIQLTVDYPEDLAAANELYEVLYQPGQAFTFARLLGALRAQPRLLQRFSKAARNEEYLRKRQQQAGTQGR